MKIVSAFLCTLLFAGWCGTRLIADINFDRNCQGYLKRAADANTVELAERNLQVAVNYAEQNNLTSGYTSILWRTPDADVGFWFENLQASLKELQSVRPDASQLEKSNMLMKLRETLLDQGQSTTITAPEGISVFPSNTAFALWGVISFVLTLVFWFLVLDEY